MELRAEITKVENTCIITDSQKICFEHPTSNQVSSFIIFGFLGLLGIYCLIMIIIKLCESAPARRKIRNYSPSGGEYFSHTTYFEPDSGDSHCSSSHDSGSDSGSCDSGGDCGGD